MINTMICVLVITCDDFHWPLISTKWYYSDITQNINHHQNQVMVYSQLYFQYVQPYQNCLWTKTTRHTEKHNTALHIYVL